MFLNLKDLLAQSSSLVFYDQSWEKKKEKGFQVAQISVFCFLPARMMMYNAIVFTLI